MTHRFLALLCLLLVQAAATFAQTPQTPVLKQALALATTDTSRVLLMADLSASYRYSRFDSVEYYAQRGLALARHIGYRKGEGRCLSRLGILQSERGNLPAALRTDLRALQLNEESRDLEGQARTLNQTGLLYFTLNDFHPSLRYYFRARSIYEHSAHHDDSQLASVLANIGASYGGMKMPDSAAFYLRQAYALASKPRQRWSSWGSPLPYVLREMGLLEATRGHDAQAIRYYQRSIRASIPENDLRSRSRTYQYLAELYQRRQQTDSSLFYARQALRAEHGLPYMLGVLRTSALLAETFEARQQHDSTLKYLRIRLAAQDSLHAPQRLRQLDALGFAEQQRLRQLEEEQARLRPRLRTYAFWMGLAVVLIGGGLLAFSERRQRRANHQLQLLNEQVNRQKDELTQQRDTLARMLQELRTTQDQLVLREKMASLGELLAGVAHEMQSPLTEIRNFAAISASLCQDIREELARVPLLGDEQEMLDEMFQNLSHYQTKIEQHSRRAETIASGMLEHAGADQLQPTDLNVLSSHYLRLAYRKFRLQDHRFNVALLLQLAPTLPLVPVVRQDVGRALAALYTHAFQAVRARQGEEDYVPQVSLSTCATAAAVEIRIRDNGPGLSEAGRTHLFTTPNLALSHSLITHYPGASLTVESQPGEYTEFVVTLPVF